jgi:hypothetical protein
MRYFNICFYRCISHLFFSNKQVVKNVGTWSKIWKRLGNFDPSITDSSFRLKKNYERYLLDYEYKTYPEHRMQAFSETDRVIVAKRNVMDAPLIRSKPDNKPNNGSRETRTVSKQRGRKGTLLNQLPREEMGVPKLPFVAGDVTIECFGEIVPKPGYYSDRVIYPIGFKSTRYYFSAVNPSTKVLYTSEIIDLGDRPLFVVTPSDETNVSISSSSPSGAWKLIHKRVIGKGGNPPPEGPKSPSLSGIARFGLNHPVIIPILRGLPNASKIPTFSGIHVDGKAMETAFSDFTSISTRKRRASSDSDSLSDDDPNYFMENKFLRKSEFPESGKAPGDESETSSESHEEIEDLESAVATLGALKYCVVY